MKLKAKEILKNVCVYLGKEELLQSNIFEDCGEEPSTLNQLELDKMLNCINLIVDEIASDYLPITKEKEITLTNGEIDVFEIDKDIHEIISIKNKFGKSLKYKYLNNKIICLASKVVVCYTVHPKKVVEIDDEAECFGGRLGERVLAYGVASEYCFLEMLYDDATIWESRFKNSLLIACRKKGEIKLKKRGWI